MSEASNASSGSTITLRRLTRDDIPAAQRLRELAGWNQTDDDWRRLLEFEPEGCFAAEIGGALAGTATTIRYDPASGPGSFGWFGMLLVDPARRRRGIGSTLLKHCVSYLESAGVETIKLDATPQGKQVYDTLGFRGEYGIERWVGLATARPNLAMLTGEKSIWTITDSDVEGVASFDLSIFGASRCRVLDAWRAGWPECALVARAHGKTAGCALARRGTRFHQIGPLIGTSPEICEVLLCEALARLAGHEIALDIPSGNAWAISIARNCGLKLQRPLIRMFRGPNRSPGRPEFTMAICCPELG